MHDDSQTTRSHLSKKRNRQRGRRLMLKTIKYRIFRSEPHITFRCKL